MIIKRDKKLSNDKASKISVVRDCLIKSEKYFNKNFDVIIDLDVTTPLRISSDIKKAVKKFIQSKSDNLVSVYKSKNNPYTDMVEIIDKKYCKLVKKPNKPILRRQDNPEVYNMNGSIYIWNRKTLAKKNDYFSGKTSYYEMPYYRSIDIDDRFDVEVIKLFKKIFKN